MTNETKALNEVIEEVKTAEKKARRAFPKHQTSAGEIISELHNLEKEVKELEDAIHHVGENTKLREIVSKELMSKKKELEDAKDTVYYF